MNGYNWPSGVAGSAGERIDRRERRRDPGPLPDNPKLDTHVPPASTTQQEGLSGPDPGLRTLYG